MLMLRILRRQPSIALLWSGQALSSIGDEIGSVAVVWLAVKMVGADTGYLLAAQFGTQFLASIVVSGIADRWDPRRTLIWTDLARCAIALAPVVAVQLMPLSMGLLWAVSLSFAALTPLFNPALQAVVVGFTADPEIRQGATGLMSTTLRIAKFAGSATIGVFSFLPMIHFFTLDALSFAISAASILAIRGAAPAPTAEVARPGFWQSLVSAYRLIRDDELMRYMFIVKSIGAGTWLLVQRIGLVLLIASIAPGDLAALGLVLSAYGLGNVVSAFVLGNLRRRRPDLIIFAGCAFMGACFTAAAFCPGVPSLVVVMVLSAVGGTLNDAPFVDFAISRVTPAGFTQIIRMRGATDTLSILICMLVSPLLFQLFSPAAVVGGVGVVLALAGGVGLFRFAGRALEVQAPALPAE